MTDTPSSRRAAPLTPAALAVLPALRRMERQVAAILYDKAASRAESVAALDAWYHGLAFRDRPYGLQVLLLRLTGIDLPRDEA